MEPLLRLIQEYGPGGMLAAFAVYIILNSEIVLRYPRKRRRRM